jgi:hypothetical protein
MKMKSPMLLIIIATGLLFASCDSYVYLPTKQNVMVFKQKGDIIVSSNAGLYNGLGLEGGYAFTDNIGLYVSFNRFDISNLVGSGYFVQDFIWDNELVFYKKFNSGLYAATNIGAGLGSLNTNSRYYSLDLNRQFAIPSIGYTLADIFEVAVSTRFTRLAYNVNSKKIDISSEYDREMFYNYFDLRNLDKPFFCVEPAISFGLDFKYAKLKVQYTWIEKPKYRELNYINDNFTTTISLNIDKIFFENKKSPKK